MNDSAWGSEHIRGLLEGEILLTAMDPATGRPAELVRDVQTAFEQRCRALDGRAPMDELLADSIQLSQAISSIWDLEVRAFMVACLGLGASNADSAAIEVEEAGLRSNRSAIGLYERGIELVRRHERARFQLLYRVRANGGMSDQPVCWRCMKSPVTRAGDECVDCPAIDSNWKPGPKPASTDEMTVEQIAATQHLDDAIYSNWRRTIPGYGKAARNEVPLHELDSEKV